MALHDYEYVSRQSLSPIWQKLMLFVGDVQKLVKEDFSFSYQPIGSYRWNMVTRDKKSNKGFDFDIEIAISKEKREHTPKEIRDIIREAFNKVMKEQGYKPCGDSTSVLKIKKVNKEESRIEYSFDFILVDSHNKVRQKYIRYNKDKNTYTWEQREKEYENFDTKMEWLRKKHHNDLRNRYIEKKNANTNPDKKSRALLAETVNELCDKYKFKIK